MTKFAHRLGESPKRRSGPRCLVQDDIAAGLISAPAELGDTDDSGHYLVYPEAKSKLGPLVQFKKWSLERV